MLPSIFGENLFDDWFTFPAFPELRNVDRKLYGRNAAHEMKTDVREHDDRYEIELKLDNGYMTVSASKGLDEEKTTKEGKLIRRERYSGSLQRSFYVGEALTEKDVTAKFENGVLTITVPKIEKPKLPESRTIAIEG